jgi:hypothetical protein
MAAAFNRLKISFLLNDNARGQFPQPPLADGWADDRQNTPPRVSLNYGLGLVVVYLFICLIRGGKSLPQPRKVAMTSFKHEDGSWEPSDNRVIRVGRVIYWLATSVAVLMVIFVIGDLYISWAQDRPILRVFALLIALLVWLIGRACRSLSGNPPLTR